MGGSAPLRLTLLEASKVRSYHSIFMDGLIKAYVASGLYEPASPPQLLAHRSFYEHLSTEARDAVAYRPIAVMDQDKRRLIRKSLLEAWVVLNAIGRSRRDELLFVTTLMPTALLLVEIFAWLLPRRHVVVMQHGELEGAFEERRQRLGSFGLYVLAWLRLRRIGSRLKVAVLDQFIADEINRQFPKAIAEEEMFIVPLPMPAAPVCGERRPGPPRCCFVGFGTINKGFDIFERLAHQLPAIEFRVIGGGYDRRLGDEGGRPVGDAESFLAAVANCDIAILPYVGGYSCSLSAAAIDALSCGLRLITSDRGCFRALEEAFGPSCVTICAAEDDMLAALANEQWLDRSLNERPRRLSMIPESRYGTTNVAAALKQMLMPENWRPAYRRSSASSNFGPHNSKHVTRKMGDR